MTLITFTNESLAKERIHAAVASKCFSTLAKVYSRQNFARVNTLPLRVHRRRRRRLKRYPLQVRDKQDWGPGFILLLPQTAAMPGSDAGSDVIKPASSFVIQNRRPRAPCGARCIGHAVST